MENHETSRKFSPADRRRVVAGASRLLRHDTLEAERLRIERIDDGVDHANRIVIFDVVVKRLGQQRRLPSIGALDETRHPILPLSRAGIVQCFGRADTVFTASYGSRRVTGVVEWIAP